MDEHMAASNLGVAGHGFGNNDDEVLQQAILESMKNAGP
jgi:hypothetical protein